MSDNVDIGNEMRPTSWTWRSGLAALTAAEAEPPADRVLAKLEATGRIQTILQLLANNPRVFRPFVLMGDALVVQTRLSPDEREVLVLALAGLKDLAYERETHLAGARRAGLSEDQIASLLSGRPDPALFGESQRLVLRVLHEMLGEGLGDEAWDQAAARWGTDGALDLIFSVAYWGGMVPLLIRALQLTEAL